MVTNLKSCCRLYMLMIVYRKIKDHSDFIILQEDLNRLAIWSKIWDLKYDLIQINARPCISADNRKLTNIIISYMVNPLW